jgi:hypothetical protein
LKSVDDVTSKSAVGFDVQAVKAAPTLPAVTTNKAAPAVPFKNDRREII